MSSPPIFFNIITCALYRQMLTFTSFTPLSSVIFTFTHSAVKCLFSHKARRRLNFDLAAPRFIFYFNSILKSICRLDTVVVNIFLSDFFSIEAFLIHDNSLLSNFLSSLKRLDYFVNVASLEWVTLSIIVPVTCKKFF